MVARALIVSHAGKKQQDKKVLSRLERCPIITPPNSIIGRGYESAYLSRKYLVLLHEGDFAILVVNNRFGHFY